MHFDYIIPTLYTNSDVDYYDDVAKQLNKTGATVAILAMTREARARLEERKQPHVFFVYEGFDPNRAVTDDELADLERRYALGSINDLVFPEEMMPGAQPRAMLIRRAAHVFRFLEGLLREHTASLFINNVGPEVIRRCLRKISDAGGPTSVVVDFAPIRGRTALTTDDVIWDDLPRELPPLSPTDRAAMERYVADVTGGMKSFAQPAKLGVGPKNFVNAAKLVRASIESRLRGENFDVSVGELVKIRAQRAARRVVNPRFYAMPVPGEKYLFFPLHLMDDSAITIRAPQFQKQEALLEYLAARALPAGYKLYVKPHPNGLDIYPVGMIAHLAKIPGVRLVNPLVNSHELIRGAAAMVVINSTVGFESLFYRKSVVTLGRVFYRGYGLTTDVENLADARDAVAQALRSPPDQERIYQFLSACHRATWPAVPFLRSDENLVALCDGIADKARRLGVVVGTPLRRPPSSTLSA